MAEIAQSSASLRFSGDDLDPIELTRLLGGEPTSAVRKGDLRTYPPNQPPRIALHGFWRLSSGYEKGDQLDHQIATILKTLTSDLAIWADLVRRFKVDMFCGVWLDEGNQGLGLTAPTLKLLGDRGIKLDLDIYYEPPESEDGLEPE
ncbi:DUF4279 domain-containing protein [Mesorhizobium sp. B2-1-3A]|uniref:DUF4279 domain-containing protein n=1 Tax=Mesorhizobium sp. B2-1-3A TaxID=2589971 RepID=UPI001126760C|nr:DUF4279 domain-containing protein [Mesorhizobium sp. B2-1-3A]TPM91425.1 DUF4279 domain-containing protein [Mesorhizobium sp. B2-1-3A]